MAYVSVMQSGASSLAADPIGDGKLSPLNRSEGLTDRVADRLREAILAGTIPPGKHLSVPQIARDLGVSRTPAREALILLEREGLVEPRASTGVAVIAGDSADILDLLDVREGLELMTVRRAAERITGEEIGALHGLMRRHEAILHRGDLAAHVETDAAFHAAIRDAAGNDRLARQLVQIDQQLRVLNGRLSRRSGWSGRAVLTDHNAIVAALVARDPDKAEAALRAHIGRIRAFHLQPD